MQQRLRFTDDVGEPTESSLRLFVRTITSTPCIALDDCVLKGRIHSEVLAKLETAAALFLGTKMCQSERCLFSFYKMGGMVVLSLCLSFAIGPSI